MLRLEKIKYICFLLGLNAFFIIHNYLQIEIKKRMPCASFFI